MNTDHTFFISATICIVVLVVGITHCTTSIESKDIHECAQACLVTGQRMSSYSVASGCTCR